MDSQEKARATREANQEAQRRLWDEKRAAISAARAGLQRVMENTEATPEQVLEAAQLLVELGK